MQIVGRKVVLVEQDLIEDEERDAVGLDSVMRASVARHTHEQMKRASGSDETRVRLEIEVPLERVHDALGDDRTGWEVLCAVHIFFESSEEPLWYDPKRC